MPSRIHATCTLPECSRPHYGHGLCHMHYQRKRKRGTTEQRLRTQSVCSVADCGRPARGRGFCHAHYARWYNGSENTGTIVPIAGTPPLSELPSHLTRREWTLFCAGFVDGEGCISVIRCKPARFYLAISVGQIDPSPLYVLQAMFGGCVKKAHRPADRRQVHQWTATCRQALSALEELEPFLIVKRDEAKLAIQFGRSINTTDRRLTADVIASRETVCRQLAALKRKEFSLPPLA